MGTALRAFVFALLVVGFFTYFANSIPQIESRPPEEVTLAEGSSPQELARLGEQVFYGKGTCALCHDIGKAGQRAPDLQGIGAKGATIRPGVSAKDYIIESLIDPGAYLVEGYGNIMPTANKPPIALNEVEMLTVVAFLQSLGGEVTVSPEDIPATGAAGAAAPARIISGDPEAGKAAFNAKGCSVCHMVDGVGGIIGPDLSSIGATSTVSYLEESILNPNAQLIAGYQPNLMPGEFAQKLTVQELNDMVAYLAGLKGGSQ